MLLPVVMVQTEDTRQLQNIYGIMRMCMSSSSSIMDGMWYLVVAWWRARGSGIYEGA